MDSMLNFLVGAREKDAETSSEAAADEIESPQVQVPQKPRQSDISDPFAAFDYDELKLKKTRLTAQIGQLKVAVKRLEIELKKPRAFDSAKWDFLLKYQHDNRHTITLDEWDNVMQRGRQRLQHSQTNRAYKEKLLLKKKLAASIEQRQNAHGSVAASGVQDDVLNFESQSQS
jgi:hypothetical protein